MMTRLIDADKLIREVEFSEHNNLHTNGRVRINHIKEHHHFMHMIIGARTVDAVPVVHGRWIPIEYDGFADGEPVWDFWECSECQEEHSGDGDTLTPYCPNCGAKMDKTAEDERGKDE